MQALLPQTIAKIFYIRFMGYRRIRKRPRTRRLCGVIPTAAVNKVNLFRPGVVRLQVFVSDWPRRRNAFFVFNLTKIFATQSRQRRAVDFRVPPDKIMNARVEGLALGVIPKLIRLISMLGKNGGRHPVLGFLRQKVTPFDQQNPPTAFSKGVGQSAPAHPGPDNHEVVFASPHP